MYELYFIIPEDFSRGAIPLEQFIAGQSPKGLALVGRSNLQEFIKLVQKERGGTYKQLFPPFPTLEDERKEEEFFLFDLQEIKQGDAENELNRIRPRFKRDFLIINSLIYPETRYAISHFQCDIYFARAGFCGMDFISSSATEEFLRNPKLQHLMEPPPPKKCSEFLNKARVENCLEELAKAFRPIWANRIERQLAHIRTQDKWLSRETKGNPSYLLVAMSQYLPPLKPGTSLGKEYFQFAYQSLAKTDTSYPPMTGLQELHTDGDRILLMEGLISPFNHKDQVRILVSNPFLAYYLMIELQDLIFSLEGKVLIENFTTFCKHFNLEAYDGYLSKP